MTAPLVVVSVPLTVTSNLRHFSWKTHESISRLPRTRPRRGRQIETTTPTKRSDAFDPVDFYHNESRLIGLDTFNRDVVS
jgi:hypothetical protein